MRILLLSISILLLLSCSNSPDTGNAANSNGDRADSTKMMTDMHNSENALDWEGRYTGILPCADCEGIETSIILKGDKTFEMRQTYLGKSDPMETFGSFSWNADGGKITLYAAKLENQQYKVGENVLIALDQSGNEITGDLSDYYRLKKAWSDVSIENITWELVEIEGEKIEAESDESKSCFVLNSTEGRISGNLGCNNFFGTYQLENGMRIGFGQLGVTMMACPDMRIEQKLNGVFEIVDNYRVQNELLYLNKAKKASLAVFKAVKQ